MHAVSTRKTRNEDENIVSIKGNSIVTVKGHITDRQGNDAKNFNGTARITVKDSEQTITCRDQTDATTVFTFQDYDSKLFSGTCNVVDGEFLIRDEKLTVPSGLIPRGVSFNK